jgi:hypothetical protein
MLRDLDFDPRDPEPDRPDPSRGGTTEEAVRQAGLGDPREVFARDLELPRGPDRERVHIHGRTYELSGSEVRTLATVGAFRVVPAADLQDPPESGSRDVRHLRELNLIESRPYVVGKTRTTVVTLTERGRNVLEQSRRDRESEPRQTFYAGISKPRELAHDSHLYRAYLRTSERLTHQGARIRRVVLDVELKREYQRFLQASNRQRRDSDGRPDRTAEEIAEWARSHQLPMDDDHVQFPDVRVEYDDRDGRRVIEDLEVMTPHYRGAHGAAKGSAGFTVYRSRGASVGSGSSRGGGRGFDPRVAEEWL